MIEMDCELVYNYNLSAGEILKNIPAEFTA